MSYTSYEGLPRSQQNRNRTENQILLGSGCDGCDIGHGKTKGRVLGELRRDSERPPAASDLKPPQYLERTITFRVTGAASVARLDPLLLHGDWERKKQVAWLRVDDKVSAAEDCGDAATSIDFVWETVATKYQRAQHRKALVLNRLSGAQVLEDKGNLALLQRLMTVPTLDSYVVKGRAAVVRWAITRFGCSSEEEAEGDPPSYPNPVLSSGQLQDLTVGVDSESAVERGAHSEHSQPGSNWWCVKAAGGNGGMDVWVLHAGNWRSVAERLQANEKYVIQRYVTRPMLWRGRKFHFRCYAILAADMSAWLYRTAFILCASRPYSLATATGVAGEAGREGLVDELVHVSNLAVNKHTEDHPGQVPCNLPLEYPELWPRMLKLLRSLVDAATPFMQHQARAGHFEFLGLDVMADEAGGVWLIEVNRLPGLQSSKQNLVQENKVYDSMMLDLIRLVVLPPLMGNPPEHGLFEAASAPAVDARVPSTEAWRNVLRFAAFKRAGNVRSTGS